MPDRIEAVAHYRRRAEQLRTIAQGVYDPGERIRLIEIAEEYERWAREKEAKGG
jgi:hypothetical protein